MKSSAEADEVFSPGSGSAQISLRFWMVVIGLMWIPLETFFLNIGSVISSRILFFVFVSVISVALGLANPRRVLLQINIWTCQISSIECYTYLFQEGSP